MSLDISAEQMARYRATARQRQQARTQALIARYRRAWAVAQQAGKVLKTEFGAQQVAVFGSLLSAEKFDERSDVDLAVWGLDTRQYYRAVSRLLDLDAEISFDLVEFEIASPELQEAIRRKGKIL